MSATKMFGAESLGAINGIRSRNGAINSFAGVVAIVKVSTRLAPSPWISHIPPNAHLGSLAGWKYHCVLRFDPSIACYSWTLPPGSGNHAS